VFEKVGETGIIDLAVEGKNLPVMVKGVQIHPLTDQILHVDLYKINLSEKVKVNVPLEITGESPAVEKKLGLLLTPVTEIEVEALPTDLPEAIEIDVTGLIAVDDAIKVSDLKVDRSKVEILADEELVVAQIGELVTKEMEAVEAEAEAEAAATVETTEGEEKTAEGEATAEATEDGEKTEGEEEKKED
jgi:large subunit ribosomal protein L25